MHLPRLGWTLSTDKQKQKSLIAKMLEGARLRLEFLSRGKMTIRIFGRENTRRAELSIYSFFAITIN